MTSKSENVIVLSGGKEFIRGYTPTDPIEFTTKIDGLVPEGISKSGRIWKPKQNQR